MKFLDSDRLASLDEREFQRRRPYPWANPSGLLTREGYELLRATLPDVSLFEPSFGKPRSHGQEPHDRYALEYHSGVDVPQAWHEFVAELRGEEYGRFLRRMLGRRHLRLSFHWHYAPRGCSISPHCDARRKIGSHIFYFNDTDDWDPAWGGQTLVLDDGGRFHPHSAPRFEEFQSIQAAKAVGNRSFLFARSRASWHGMYPLECPEDAMRRVFIVVVNHWARGLVRAVRGRLEGRHVAGY